MDVTVKELAAAMTQEGFNALMRLLQNEPAETVFGSKTRDVHRSILALNDHLREQRRLGGNYADA